MAKERESASRRWALSPREGVQGKSEPRLIKQPILFMKEPPPLVVRMDPSLPKGFHKKLPTRVGDTATTWRTTADRRGGGNAKNCRQSVLSVLRCVE